MLVWADDPQTYSEEESQRRRVAAMARKLRTVPLLVKACLGYC